MHVRRVSGHTGGRRAQVLTVARVASWVASLALHPRSCVDFPGGNAVRISSPLASNIGLYRASGAHRSVVSTQVNRDRRHSIRRLLEYSTRSRALTVDEITFCVMMSAGASASISPISIRATVASLRQPVQTPDGSNATFK